MPEVPDDAIQSPTARDDVVSALTPVVEWLERTPEIIKSPNASDAMRPIFGGGPDILEFQKNALRVIEEAEAYVGYDVDPYTLEQTVRGIESIDVFIEGDRRAVLAKRIRALMAGAKNCPGGYHYHASLAGTSVDWARVTNPFVWVVEIVKAVVAVIASVFRKTMFIRGLTIVLFAAGTAYGMHWLLDAELPGRLGYIVAGASVMITLLNAIWPQKK